MSFKLFVYYCAVCGAWGALLTWGVMAATGMRGNVSALGWASMTGGLLGLLVASSIGAVDALLNAVGFQRVLRVLVCLVVGLAGGLLGGFVGQALKEKMNFPIFIGWIITGVCIGASLGVYDLLRALSAQEGLRVPLKKVLNGVYGGLVGGFLGGLLFGLITPNEHIPRTDLALGLVILGLCIGLFIGLAQVILKEAWIKVAAGFRAGRELMLSREETTIGRAESCDLGLFGDSSVERLHARILLEDNRYLLADADTPGGTYLNDRRVTRPTPLRSGDTIRVGNSVLKFGERQKRPQAETRSRHR
jgi:hypothetical protein